MTRRQKRVSAVGLALSVLLAALGITAEPGKAPKKSDPWRIGSLNREGVTPQQRTQLGMAYLREEIADPTPPYMSMGPIDHEYIIAQLTIAIAQPSLDDPNHADREMLFQELQRQPAGEYRDALALTLAMTGDARMTKYVLAYLRDTNKPPILREQAVRALSRLADPETAPLLLPIAVADPVYEIVHAKRRIHGRDPSSPVVKEYPMRRHVQWLLSHSEAFRNAMSAQARLAVETAQIEVPIPAELQQELARQLRELDELRRQAREKGEPIPPTQYYRDR